MPVYNGEKYIRQALDSLLAQTFIDFKIVISDNASTDGTEAICNEYVKKDSRVECIRQPTNIGLINNFNFLLKNARSDYFAWMAHDDYLDASSLQIIVGYLDEHTDVACCMGDSNVVNNGVIVNKRIHNEIRDNVDWIVARRNFFTYSHNLVMPIYGVFRLNILQKNNIYLKPGFRGTIYGLERSILPRVALQGRIVALPMVLQHKRVQEQSLSVTEPKQIKQLQLFCNVIYIIIKHQGRTALFSNLTLRQKLQIFIEMVSFDTPVILVYAWRCIPSRWHRWTANVRMLLPLRNKMITALKKQR